MAFALFISLAVFLSICTNLRVTGFSVGTGEILLLLLMGTSLALKPWEQAKCPLFLFWVAVWACTALGFVFGSVTGNLRLHNSLAYAYTGLLTLSLLTVFTKLSQVDLRRTLFYFVVISVGALWLGLLAYVNLDSGALNFFRIDTVSGRYQGWCQNANQMSLLLVPTPFLVVYLWATSTVTTMRNVGWGILLLLSVTMGFIVRSDALGFSWILGILILGAIYLRQHGHAKSFHLITVLLVFIVGFLGVRFAVEEGWLGQSPQGSLYSKQTGIEKLRVGYGETDQKVGIRLQLWKNALQVWKVSPIVGHGPGAYSSVDLDPLNHFDGMEAHNTVIDLLVQGGVLLALAYAGLFVWLTTALWRTRQWLLLISMLMIFSFEFFMFHMRQPVIWFYLSLILALAQQQIRSDSR